MPVQFQPFVIGAMLIVAVGTALYSLWSNNRDRERPYSYDGYRDDNYDYDGSSYYDGASANSRDDFDNDSESRKRRNAGLKDQCTICLMALKRELKNLRDLKCGHCFHSRCISTWLVDHDTCPICRCNV